MNEQKQGGGDRTVSPFISVAPSRIISEEEQHQHHSTLGMGDQIMNTQERNGESVVTMACSVASSLKHNDAMTAKPERFEVVPPLETAEPTYQRRSQDDAPSGLQDRSKKRPYAGEDWEHAPPSKRGREDLNRKLVVSPCTPPFLSDSTVRKLVGETKFKPQGSAVTSNTKSSPSSSVGVASKKDPIARSSNKPSMDEAKNASTVQINVKPEIDPAKKEAPKMSSTKLGIPLRWLQPAVKPKKTEKSINESAAKPSINSGPRNKDGSVPPTKSRTVSSANPKKPWTVSSSSPPHVSNRLVTDSSEGGSTVSLRDAQNAAPATWQMAKVPAAIVTTKKSPPNEPKVRNVESPLLNCAVHIVSHMPSFQPMKDTVNKEDAFCLHSHWDESRSKARRDEWDSDASESSESSSDCNSDREDDLNQPGPEWCGVNSVLPSTTSTWQTETTNQPAEASEEKLRSTAPPKLKIRLSSAKLQLLANSRRPENEKTESSILKSSLSGTRLVEVGDNLTDEKSQDNHDTIAKKKRKSKIIPLSAIQLNRPAFDAEQARLDMEEERRKREEAKLLTAEQIRAILGEDDSANTDGRHWVRRSVRQPSKALLNSKPVRMLIDKLKMNDREMVVLKMKKYINDPNAPSAVLDAALNAMEENTNCEALYIQVRS
jgi:hypothetical protein